MAAVPSVGTLRAEILVGRYKMPYGHILQCLLGPIPKIDSLDDLLRQIPKISACVVCRGRMAANGSVGRGEVKNGLARFLRHRHQALVVLDSGTMLPSVFIAANCWSNRSGTASVPIALSSFTPMKTRPGFSRPAKSLAKAQIASQILVAASLAKDSLNSTRSVSPAAMICRNSSSVKSGIAIAPLMLVAG